MSSYADTSFLVSLYGEDVNSRAATALFLEHRPVFLITPLGETEFTSAVFAAPTCQKGWSVDKARRIEEDFLRDLEAGTWKSEDLPVEAWARARELCRRHGPSLGSRALDALHVASALLLGADEFYTFDRDQAKLARAAGLRVLGC